MGLRAYATEPPVMGARMLTNLEGEYSFSAAQTTLGNDKQQLLTGGFAGFLTFDADTLLSNDIRSGFMGLIDSTNHWLWYTHVGGSGYSQVNSALALEDGWLLAGVFADTIMLGNTQLVAQDYQSVFLARINLDGEIVKARQIDLVPAGGKHYLSSGPGGSVFLGAEFTGDFQHMETVYKAYNNKAVLVMKLDDNAEVEQIEMMSSRASLDLQVFETLPGGKLLMGFGFRDTLYLGPHHLLNSGMNDFALARLNSNLEIEQYKISEGNGSKHLTGAVRHPGGFVFYGTYTGAFSWENHSFDQEPGQHIFMIKLVGNGNMAWAQSINGYSSKMAAGLVAGQYNQLYLWANYRGNMHFMDQEYNTEDFTHQWFTARFSPQGTPQWISLANNTNNLQAGIAPGIIPGRLTMAGLSRTADNTVYSHSIQSTMQPLMLMEFQDCAFAKKPNFPADTLFCGPGLLEVGADFNSCLWNYTIESTSYWVETSGWVYAELTDLFGCKVVDSIYVEVAPSFEIAITGHNHICPEDGSALLLVDTQAEVFWSTGENSNLLFVQEPGLYEAIAVNLSGCMALASHLVTAWELEAPSLLDYYLMDPQGTLVLNPGIYASYNWSNGQQGQELILTGSEYDPGTYLFSVMLADFQGCTQQHDFMVDILATQTHSDPVQPADDGTMGSQVSAPLFEGTPENVGLFAFSELEQCDFILYPNPGQGPVYLSDLMLPKQMSNHTDLRMEVMIFGSLGDLVQKENNMAMTSPWELQSIQNLSPGHYHLALLINNKLCTVKNLILLP